MIGRNFADLRYLDSELNPNIITRVNFSEFAKDSNLVRQYPSNTSCDTLFIVF